MTSEERLAYAARRLARTGFEDAANAAREKPASDAAWRAIRDTGTRLWLDTGDLDEAAGLWVDEFEALTTNNTLLNKEVQKGLYDGLVREAEDAIRTAVPEIAPRRLILEIAFILNARHGLSLVQRFGAFVSVELHTDLAHDVDRSVAYGLRYREVCPERFIVKIPLTPAGIVAARRLSDAGVTINFTLGFSARQNVFSALVARPAFVNVFMGRLGAFVADNHLGDGANIGEKATLATQRAIRSLRASGRAPSLLIGASMRNGPQVGALAGLDVFTMPPKVAAQYRASPLESVASRIGDDPPVAFAGGVGETDIGAQTLWEVPPALESCAERLAAENPDRLTPDLIVDRLASAGFGDLFPSWTGDDIQTVAADGKIPVVEHWRDRLASGTIGLDALMNLSAFHSFVADQTALDKRIASHLAP